MTDPSIPAPGQDTPAPPPPEIDPAGAPDELPAPDVLPDDGYGRPVDGSVLGAETGNIG